MTKKRTEMQTANALLTAYQNFYMVKYGIKPTINRYRDKWGMLDVMQELEYSDTLEIMEYFFVLPMDHSLQSFYTNFDKVIAAKQRSEKDREHRKNLLQRTIKLMEGQHES